MTKEELITLIEANITTNGMNEITGAIDRGVLTEIVNTLFGNDGMSAIARFKGLATAATNPGNPDTVDYYIARVDSLVNQNYIFFNVTVNAGELALLKRNGNIWEKHIIGTVSGDGGAIAELTAEQIRDALQSLSGSTRLNKMAVFGADFALNFRAKMDILNGQAMQQFGFVLPGDFWIASGITETDVLKNGDWIVAVADDISTPIDPAEYTDPTYWTIFPMHALSGAEIVTKLESLTPSSRLHKSFVRGADFALNRRGKGDVMDATFRVDSMNNILKGDLWIYWLDGSGGTDALVEGDWVIAMCDNPDNFNYEDTANWWILKFSAVGGVVFTQDEKDWIESQMNPYQNPILSVLGSNLRYKKYGYLTDVPVTVSYTVIEKTDTVTRVLFQKIVNGITVTLYDNNTAPALTGSFVSSIANNEPTEFKLTVWYGSTSLSSSRISQWEYDIFEGEFEGTELNETQLEGLSAYATLNTAGIASTKNFVCDTPTKHWFFAVPAEIVPASPGYIKFMVSGLETVLTNTANVIRKVGDGTPDVSYKIYRTPNPGVGSREVVISTVN